MIDVLDAIGDWLAALASLGVIVVWAAYGLFFRWSKTRSGRAVFVFLTALVLIFFLNAVSLWFGKVWGTEDFNLRLGFRILVYTFGLAAVTWLGYALFTNWRRTGVVLNLEARARKAKATLGEPITEETPIQ